MAPIREQDVSPNGRRTAFERDESSGIEYD